MNLLTEPSRLAWLAWKASTSFNWRPGIDSPQYVQRSAIDGYNERIAASFDTPEKRAWLPHVQQVVAHPPTKNDSVYGGECQWRYFPADDDLFPGLACKIPGQVGDSPIIGAGCSLDNEVGAAGSTEKGRENVKVSGGHTIVEVMMRRGKSPTEACMEAMSRVAHNYKNDKKN